MLQAPRQWSVLSYMGSFKNLQSRKQANLAMKEPNEASEKVATVVSQLGGFSEDEISKLRSFPETILCGSCSIV